MALYLIPSGPMPTTAAFATLATGTAIKTLLQVAPGATTMLRVVEWGISFDGFAAALPGKVELVETDVTATVTASGVNDIVKLDSDALLYGNPTTALIAAGYNASAEGTITATRSLGGPQLIAPTSQFIQQYPLGREPVIQTGKFGRIRVTFGTTVNAYCYMVVLV